MATVTFTAATIDIYSVDGPGGGLSPNWDAVCAGWGTSVIGDTGVVVRDFTSAFPTSVITVFASPHDDGVTVPALITITNLNFQFDWAITNVSAVGGNVSEVGAGDPPPPMDTQAAGASSGHFNQDVDPAAYIGGTTRADLFAVPSIVAWNHHWIPSTTIARTSGRVAISNYAFTVTYTPGSTLTGVTPDTGTYAGGTTVTIAGTGLNGATGIVTFGGDAATVVSITDTAITVLTPVHALGVVDVVVAGIGTLSAAYTYAVTIVKLPPIPYNSPLLQPS